MTIEETLAGPLRSRTEVVSAYADSWPNIILGGVQQFAYWNSHVYAEAGEAITVAREVDPNGVARNTVIGRIGRPGATEGTVLSADGTKAVVSVGAVEVTAAYNSGLTLVGGDTVRLLWQGRIATVLAKLTSYVQPPLLTPGTTAPPPANSSGELSVFATDSATFATGLGWNNWAGGRQNVYQGPYSGYTMYGAWFYNGATKQLAGATINRLRIRIPKRLAVGSYNTAGTLHVYAHSSDTRPGGDVPRIAGPYDLTIPAQWQGDFMDLPAAAGDALKNGGGFSIAGAPYLGLAGKAEDPASGQILANWSR